MFVRAPVVLLLAAGLAGCGSMHTIRSGSSANPRDIGLNGTYCESIPRVYSGVAYDFCWLHGDPYVARSVGGVGYGGSVAGWPLIDMALSGVTDTLALPYTIYRQSGDGSIELTHGD